MAEQEEVTVTLSLQEGYQFLVDFHQPGVPPLVVDEPEPLGAEAGPNAARLLGAAIANCLSASALFCLRKARITVYGMSTSADVSFARDERGHLRLGGITVHIHPEVAEDDVGRMHRCVDLFEDYCAVTQSVRSGLNVSVEVEPVPVLADGATPAS
ncbi:OsmC family protein [Saccharopolyspora phatthalungensis]|uniref:Putative OsmC-like protein n=1 Tax=Saccharopolyspora phatthalungensis TaxID=664693 RepID=A0A840QJ30_9PSEU|nr:OsmC family protein [Saccharopolyspora phatthalungensis]MBB5157563.1 putative OsmC-like protein [Saccharopolyspora phatthalungensis]